jgi:hypothetical protein
VSLGSLGRLVLVLGVMLVVLGLALLLVEHLGLRRLPGDIVWQRGNVRVYVPLGLMVLLSLLLTLLLNLLLRR